MELRAVRLASCLPAVIGCALAGWALGGCSTATNPKAPMLTGPQLEEQQQSMPEMQIFDGSTPPAGNGLSSPLGSPSAPPLGSGAVLGQ
jgi:hypothetical protein